MRFLSVLALSGCVLSGCALVDAAGESKLVGAALAFEPSTIATATPPLQVEVANLDGQNRRDLVVLSGDDDLLQGIDVGLAYELGQVSPVLTGPYTAVAAGDADGVDPDDMAAAGLGKLNVFGSTGKSLDSHLIAGLTPASLQIGTFPFFGGPGRSLVIGYVESTMVSIVIDVFEAQVQTRVLTASQPPVAIVLANTRENGAGQDEILVVERSEVIEAQGDAGEFSTFGRSFPGIEITHVAVGDFGSDAQEDLAYAHAGGISIAFGSPSGLVAGVTAPVVGQGLAIRDLGAGDFDGDGRPDLVVLAAGQLHVFLRNLDETFTEHVLPIEGTPTRLSVGDLDDDGTDDFLLTPGKEGGIDLLLSR